MNRDSGFKEIAHTADWELEVWGSTFEMLLEQAAKGMYALMRTKIGECKRQRAEIYIESIDKETMMVDFLSELLYWSEEKGMAFVLFQIDVDGNKLKAEVWGCPIKSQEKGIKAVTYHQLAIHQTEDGFRTRIVFDV